MAARLAVGYKGLRVTENEWLRNHTYVLVMEKSLRDRVAGAMIEFARAGGDIGIGGAGRTTAFQDAEFLRRHHPTKPGEKTCHRRLGVAYTINPGRAECAPGGFSFHEFANWAGQSDVILAVDSIGDLIEFNRDYAPKYGIINFEFVNGELWHNQGNWYPKGRSQLPLSKYAPAPSLGATTPAEVPPDPKAIAVVAKATITSKKVASALSVKSFADSGKEVATLQHELKVFGWYPYRVDGLCGDKTVEGIRKLQEECRVKPDGVYGKKSEAANKELLNYLAAAK